MQRRPIFILHREKIFQSNFRMVEINLIKTGDVQFNALSMYFINYINQQDKRRNQTLSWCVCELHTFIQIDLFVRFRKRSFYG